MYILLALLFFGLLIFIHELGHFVVARLCGVKVLEFAIGMGPKLLSKASKKSGITYSLRAIPIGGFVSMLGENGMEAVQGSSDDLFRHAAACALNTGIVKEGDLVVFTGSSQVSTPGSANTMRIENIHY